MSVGISRFYFHFFSVFICLLSSLPPLVSWLCSLGLGLGFLVSFFVVVEVRRGGSVGTLLGRGLSVSVSVPGMVWFLLGFGDFMRYSLMDVRNQGENPFGLGGIRYCEAFVLMLRDFFA